MAAVEDLIKSGCGQRPATGGALEDDEHVVVDRVAGTLSIQVAGQLCEERRNDRDEALVAALAVGDEHAPVADVDIAEPQPEDLAVMARKYSDELRERATRMAVELRRGLLHG